MRRWIENGVIQPQVKEPWEMVALQAPLKNMQPGLHQFCRVWHLDVERINSCFKLWTSRHIVIEALGNLALFS